MAELTAHKRYKFKIPSGGKWFGTKPPVLELLRDEDQFVVAWDKNKKGAKVFGIYPTFEDFWTNYLKNKPEERWGYEVVLRDKPVKFHMDIEYWTDEPDSMHTKLRMVTAWLRGYLTSLYAHQPEIYVMCGTRPDDGKKIKNSYHLVIDNYVCANNKQDGTMKEIYRIMQGLGDEWQTIKPGKDKPQCIVDDSICSADRCMRLLLSSKLGKNYPFYCLTEDGYYDDLFCEPQDTYDLYDAEFFHITDPDKNGDRIQFKIEPSEQCETTLKKSTAKTKGEASAPRVQRAVNFDALPFNMQAVTMLLCQFGDDVSKPYNATQLNKEGTEYKISFNQNKQRRRCLYDLTRFHDSNNISITLARAGNSFDVQYHCFGQECCKLHNIKLGSVRVLPEFTQEAADISNLDRMMETLSTNEDNKQTNDEGTHPADADVVQIDPIPALIEPRLPQNDNSLITTRGFLREPDECYNEPEVRKLPKKRVIAIRSACGTGKTKQLNKFLQHLAKEYKTPGGVDGSDMCVVYVSHRKAISLKLCSVNPRIGGQKWTMYQDIVGAIKVDEHPFLVVQFESLCRVIAENTHLKLVLVLDEWNSLCNQMHSNCGDPVGAQASFLCLLHKSAHIIAMDGYLDEMRLDILEKYVGEPAYLIHNEYKSRTSHTITTTTDLDGTIQFLMKLVENDENVVVPCMCKSLAEKINAIALAKFGTKKKVLLYTKDQPWKGEDVNVAWTDADLVIYTPTIDCGISYEVSNHYKNVIAFLDGNIGVTHETAAQMISRTRDAKLFLLYFAPIRCKIKQSICPNHILKELNTKGDDIRRSDIEFFGIRDWHRNRSNDWTSCNAYAATLVAKECTRRRALNNFPRELLALLQQDGADVLATPQVFEKMPNIVVFETMPSIVVQAEQSSGAQVASQDTGNTKERRIQELRQEYRSDCFKAMDVEDLKRYEKPQKKNAFRQRRMLTRNGRNFTEAMQQMARNMAKAAAGLDLCASSGHYDPNIVTRAEVQAGIFGGCYDLEANKAASQLVFDYTAVRDPFAIPTMTEEQIAEHVGCEMQWCKSKDKRKGKEKLCLTLESKDRILKHMEEWIIIRPELHTPYRMPPKFAPLTLVKAMHLLDHVLATMYDMRYVREKNPKKSNQTRVHKYSLVETSDFAINEPDKPSSKVLPNISPWATAPVEDLAEGEVLLAAGANIQIAPKYAKRQAENHSRNKLPPILPGDIEPSPKRMRFE